MSALPAPPRVIDRGALGVETPKGIVERVNRSDILRAYRVHVYGQRWQALLAARPVRELLADPEATVILGDVPPEQPRGLCDYPGCDRPPRWSQSTLCHGHQKQATLRGRAGMKPLPPMRVGLPPRMLAERGLPCPKCNAVEWVKHCAGYTYCRMCKRRAYQRKKVAS